MAELQIDPLTAVIGAEVGGIDLAAGLGDADVAALRTALLKHKVLFFRAQHLDAATLAATAARFGPLTPAHPVEPAVAGHPEILALDSDEGARADVWHSDLTFQSCPPLGAMLHALEVPVVGGDTLWADLTSAYEALSPSLRRFLEGLTATHSAAKAGAYFAARDDIGDKAAATAASAPVSHPVVRVHPETARRSLFVNPLFTTKVDGLRRRESDAVLAVVHDVAVQPERLVRWRWRAGDLACWDNRCTMH